MIQESFDKVLESTTTTTTSTTTTTTSTTTTATATPGSTFSSSRDNLLNQMQEVFRSYERSEDEFNEFEPRR